MHKSGRRNAIRERLYKVKWQNLCKIIDYCIWSLIKHEYVLRKRKANVGSNIQSHQHLMGHGWGLLAENGVPSPQITHSNYCLQVKSFDSRQSRRGPGLPPPEHLRPNRSYLFLANDRCLRDYDLVVTHCWLLFCTIIFNFVTCCSY